MRVSGWFRVVSGGVPESGSGLSTKFLPCRFRDGSGGYCGGRMWPGGPDALLLVWVWVLGLVPDGSGNLGACFQG